MKKLKCRKSPKRQANPSVLPKPKQQSGEDEPPLALVAQVAAAIHAQQWGRDPDADPAKAVYQALRLIKAIRMEWHTERDTIDALRRQKW